MSRVNSIAREIISIREYYRSLKYDNIILYTFEANQKLSRIIDDLNCLSNRSFSDRFLDTIFVMKDNLLLFNCICTHVDTVTTIMQYLIKFHAKFRSASGDRDEYSDEELLMLLILTLFDITNNYSMNTFLEHAIIKNSYLEDTIIWKRTIDFYHHIKTDKKYQNHVMIVLQDSDLHAVIYSLKTSNYEYNLEIIWLHELIGSKFISLIEKYSVILSVTTKVNTFQFKEEVTSYISNKIKRNNDKMNIVSIWSEDITTAESLAKSTNANVIFINAYMNFYGYTILLPYLKLLIEESIYDWRFVDFDDSTIEHLNCKNKINGLYYDGMWQSPIKNLYWLNEGELWADASVHDYFKCLNSAKKGFEIWRTTSIDVKLNFISDFVSILKTRGETELAELMESEWKEFAYLYEITLKQFQKAEVTQIQEPRGIILLNEKEKDMFFYKLMLTLISGNTVIVIFTADCCFNPALFFEMFAMSKIPPGVINLLSSSNKELKNLKSSFCETNFGRCSKERIFIGDKMNQILKLTIPMQVIIRVK